MRLEPLPSRSCEPLANSLKGRLAPGGYRAINNATVAGLDFEATSVMIPPEDWDSDGHGYLAPGYGCTPSPVVTAIEVRHSQFGGMKNAS